MLNRQIESVYVPEVSQYKGATGISASTARALDKFVRTGKRDGWWGKLAEVYPFCGPNLTASLVKLKSFPGVATSLVNNSFVSSDYAENVGFGQSATAAKWLQTGVSFDSIGMTPTNFSYGMFLYNTKADQANSGNHLGTNTAADTFWVSPTGIGNTSKSLNTSASGASARVMSSDSSHFHNRNNGILMNRSTAGNVNGSFTTSDEILLGCRRPAGANAASGKMGLTWIGNQALSEAETLSISRAMLVFDRTVRTGMANAASLPWAFIGDSIVYGQGVTATSNQYTNIVAAARGRIEYNFGVPNSATTFDQSSGGGWAVSLQNRYADIFAINFDKVIISYGGNDANADSSTNGDGTKIATYQAGFTTILQDFVARYGASNVFGLTTQWRADKNDTYNTAWNAGFLAACSAASVTVADYYTDVYFPLDATARSNLRFDNNHPNIAGSSAMATKLLTVV